MRDIIKTDRLVLRPFVEADWKSLVNYAGDIDVARATGRLPHPYTEADAKGWIAITKTTVSDHIYCISNQDNHLIGCISLTAGNCGWAFGYWLGQQFWHKGYMREAGEALLSEARRCLAPLNISACVFKDNPRSLAALDFFGFKVIADTLEFCLARGQMVDGYRLELILTRKSGDA